MAQELKPGQVNIKGKVYDTVALRVQKFRESHPLWSLKTEIIARDAEIVVMRAGIEDETGRLLATGHSEERRKASQINSTSALENAETSAIGRALAALGLGGTEFATADEVANAISQQKTSGKKVTEDAWDRLTTDEQTWLNDIKESVLLEYEQKGPAAAMAVLEEQNLSSDHKVALWYHFDAKERAAMEPHKSKRKQKEVANV